MSGPGAAADTGALRSAVIAMAVDRAARWPAVRHGQLSPAAETELGVYAVVGCLDVGGPQEPPEEQVTVFRQASPQPSLIGLQCDGVD